MPNSRLLLKGKPFADTLQRYQSLFAEHGLDNTKVECVGRVTATSGHLDLYNRIDIALDPFPYNGTTTTCEALWMGVPVVTYAGRVHAARVGVSLLSNIQAEDWIALDEQAYVDTAISLGR